MTIGIRQLNYPDLIFGMDSSRWEDIPETPVVPNFEIAYQKGCKFNYLKATQGLWVDRSYRQDWANCRKTPMKLGAYHFLQWDIDPVKQADFFYNTIKNDPGELPPVVDFEWWSTIPSNAFDILYRFLERLKQLMPGKKLAIYTAYGFWMQYGKKDAYWKQYLIWLARYENTPPIGPTQIPAPWIEYYMWQYTGHGDGTYFGMESKDVDLDYANPKIFNELVGEIPDEEETDDENNDPNDPIEEENPEGDNTNNMWEKNALIVAFDKTGDSTLPKTIDFSALKAAGVYAVILRAGTSDSNFNYDDPSANFVNSPTYKTWFTQAKAAGLRILSEYDFNAMLDSVNGYNGIRSLQHINYVLSGGFKTSPGGALLLNCERNTWKESIKNVTCVSSMYGKDLQNVFNAIYGAHKLVPGVRTGRWFLNLRDGSGVSIDSQCAFLDKGQATVPLFLARWKKTNVLVSGDFRDVVKDISDPALTTEQADYLYFGNSTKWSGWELATVKHEAVKDSLGKLSTFRLILWNGNPTEFDAYFNFPAIEPPDEEEPEEPEEPGDEDGDGGGISVDLKDYVKKTEFDALVTVVNGLKARLDGAKLVI